MQIDGANHRNAILNLNMIYKWKSEMFSREMGKQLAHNGGTIPAKSFWSARQRQFNVQLLWLNTY